MEYHVALDLALDAYDMKNLKELQRRMPSSCATQTATIEAALNAMFAVRECRYVHFSIYKGKNYVTTVSDSHVDMMMQARSKDAPKETLTLNLSIETLQRMNEYKQNCFAVPKLCCKDQSDEGLVRYALELCAQTAQKLDTAGLGSKAFFEDNHCGKHPVVSHLFKNSLAHKMGKVAKRIMGAKKNVAVKLFKHKI